MLKADPQLTIPRLVNPWYSSSVENVIFPETIHNNIVQVSLASSLVALSGMRLLRSFGGFGISRKIAEKVSRCWQEI